MITFIVDLHSGNWLGRLRLENIIKRFSVVRHFISFTINQAIYNRRHTDRQQKSLTENKNALFPFPANNSNCSYI